MVSSKLHSSHCHLLIAVVGIFILSSIPSIPLMINTDAFMIWGEDSSFRHRRVETTRVQRSTPPRPAATMLFSSLEGTGNPETTLDETFDSNVTITGTESVSKTSIREERKRYDAELEEAFAQQTRDRNPLLGVKSIGVDYGLVRTGVAVTIGYNPQTLDVIVTDHPLLAEYEAEKLTEDQVAKEEERRLEIQRSKVAERVIELAKRENADRIVVGLPLHKNGTEAPQSILARKFASDHLVVEALRFLGPGVSVYMCDERYTSKEAAARIRTKNARGNPIRNGDDLYGLLDAESAKIILEQYYDDHLQRYNTRATDRTGDGHKCEVNANFNGERVTIDDPKIIQELTSEYNERQNRERDRLAKERNEREARAKWRKLAMEKERLRAEEQRKIDEDNGISTSKKKKKKKKRKRK